MIVPSVMVALMVHRRMLGAASSDRIETLVVVIVKRHVPGGRAGIVKPR